MSYQTTNVSTSFDNFTACQGYASVDLFGCNSAPYCSKWSNSGGVADHMSAFKSYYHVNSCILFCNLCFGLNKTIFPSHGKICVFSTGGITLTAALARPLISPQTGWDIPVNNQQVHGSKQVTCVHIWYWLAVDLIHMRAHLTHRSATRLTLTHTSNTQIASVTQPNKTVTSALEALSGCD